MVLMSRLLQGLELVSADVQLEFESFLVLFEAFDFFEELLALV
jgi:hypothetical protein